jgi:hypothetical protein
VSKRYPTETSSQGLVHPNPKLERYFRRRVNKKQTSNNLDLDPIVEDIRCLFENIVSVNMVAPWLDEIYKPLDFSNINGYPNDVPKKVIEKLPTFQGNMLFRLETIGKPS